MTSHSPDERRRRRRPLHTIANHGLRHPFRDRHVNFPPFEDACSGSHKTNKTAIADNSTSFLSDSNNINNNADMLDIGGHDDDISDDDSTAGSSDGGMSIGARAALQDHVRYVARYGVDGDVHRHSFRHFDIDDDDYDDVDDDDANSNDCENENALSIRIKLEHQDAVWNHLLDTSFASPTLSTVTSTDGNILDRSQGMNRSNNFERNAQNNNIIINDDDNNKDQENGGIEVSLVDTSACYSDYFNTSKVWLLATPEKIKTRPQPNFTSTYRRSHHLHNEPADLDNDSFHADSNTTPLTHGMLALHLHNHENPNAIPVDATTTRHGRACDIHEGNSLDANESFAGGVDVSRISAADSERTPLRGSPRRWIADDITNDSVTTTPQRQREQRLADVSFGSLLSPVMPITPSNVTSNIRRSPSRNYAPPSLPNDTQDLSNPTTFRPRPQRTSATIPEHYGTDYPQHQPAFWLSPTEAHAADLASEFVAWTDQPAPFPDTEEGAPTVCGVKNEATRSSPGEDGKERPRYAFGATQHKPSIHRQPPKPLAFPDDYSSVASSSGATSLFLLDDACPKTTKRFNPIHSPPIDGVANPDVSFNVSAIEDDSTDGMESWSRRPEPSPMTSPSDKTPPLPPLESSFSSSFSSSLPMPTTNNPVAAPTRFDQMEDRRRYRTVVPNRVLFDETDDNHYHHCRDDSFSVAPSY